ncbi:MAG TPA: response regulator [Sorangium sp.]|uniref:response regulator n=1 Tax=Sorangium sp. So ce1153 TaxID=3133333 RepID=UPI002D0D7C15|nr:response regulator [Sorangium sp.]
MALRKAVILLIDDSEIDRTIYGRYLRDWADVEVKLIEAATGKAALEECRKSPPDCIILDYRLPDMDGLELLEKLKRITEAPVIFITGQPAPMMLTRAQSLGIAGYLWKEVLGSARLRETILSALKVCALAVVGLRA